MIKDEIILIGPIGSGKTTVADLLSLKTGWPRRSMDELRWHYYDEIGYDRGLARQIRSNEGFWGLYRYWKPFELHAARRLLEDFQDCIFDFGGGQTDYEDESQRAQIRDLLAPCSHVILLLPSPDPDESIRILNARNEYDSDDQRAVNEHLVRHHSHHDLAKYTIYTKNKDPEQICDEILAWVKTSMNRKANP